MTSITSNVFSGLTGASPVLLSRAVALINNSGLTSLEPLRHALVDGSTVIRAATADDMVPPGVHATFRDPVRDPETLAILEPGQIIVRTEYLTSASDPAVLQFVDDIFHEGMGHGAQSSVDGRARANSDLSLNPQELSTTDRGDAYVKAWIDDETSARYITYTFRKELATLNSEYSASNRAILATDDTFKEFARLDAEADGMGLTSTDKGDYIVEQARPVVAAYNNHFYRDAGSKHVMDALNLNGTQEGQAYAAHVKATYNAVGYIVTDVVMHDDNSSSASVIYENGDRRDVVFDSSGNLYQEQRTAANGDSTITRYDAPGRPTQVTEIDGAQDDADYSTRFTAIDSQGRTDFTDFYRDDGARDRVDDDQDARQTWARSVSHFDAQGREDWRIIANDDGSKDWTDFDQTNSRGDSIWANRTDAQGREDWRNVTMDDGSRDWNDFDQANVDSVSRWGSHYDAQGRTDWADAVYDDGSRNWTDFDQANVRGDSIWSNRTDAQGREDWRNVTMDDGSREWTDFDQNQSQALSRYEARFDSQGREDWRNAVYDDGHRDWTDFDQDNSQALRQYEARFDAQGRVDWQNVIQDDGSRDWADFDEQGNQELRQYEAHYDPVGRLDFQNAIYDDGRRNRSDYDQDGSQGWSRVDSQFDAQGREDNASMFLDDGRRNWYDCDQDGSQGWSRVESQFDAQGREDRANMFMDDGRRTSYDYDQDSSQAWSEIINHYNANGQLMDSYQERDNGTYIDYFYGTTGELEAVSEMDAGGVHHWMDKHPDNDYTIEDAGLADDGFDYYYFEGPPQDEGNIWYEV